MRQVSLPLWQVNKERVDPFNVQVIKLLRQHAGLFVQVVVADQESDMKRNTDFMVKVEGGDIACRIRDADKYWRRYGDITFRNSVASGARTEADKVIDGFGRWMFYGWADMESMAMIAWVLIDLNVVRAKRMIQQARERHQTVPVPGGNTLLYVQRQWLVGNGAIAASGGEAGRST